MSKNLTPNKLEQLITEILEEEQQKLNEFSVDVTNLDRGNANNKLFTKKGKDYDKALTASGYTTDTGFKKRIRTIAGYENTKDLDDDDIVDTNTRARTWPMTTWVDAFQSDITKLVTQINWRES